MPELNKIGLLKEKLTGTKDSMTFDILFTDITIEGDLKILSNYLFDDEIPNNLPCFLIGIKGQDCKAVALKIFDYDLNFIKEVSLPHS